MPSPRSRRALIGLSLGYFMVLFDTTALTVALPSLARDLGGGVEELAWVTDAYTITFAGCLLAGGVAADRLGADRTFLGGLAGFGALSLVCAAAPSTTALVGARALLGVSGALLLPASLSLVSGLHPAPASRARAIAAWASISGSALAAGPLLGGALVAALGWRGIFVVNAPVAVLAALLVHHRLPVVRRGHARVDLVGQVAVLVAVAALSWALIRGGADDWTAIPVLAGLVLSLVAAAVAVRAERASSVPAVPPALRGSPAFAAVSLGGLVVGGVLAGELFLTTLQLQETRGLGPILTGAAFLPLTLPMILNPPLAARLIARTGPARPVLGGLLLVAVAAAVLAAVPATAAYVWIAVGLLLLGFGVSLTLPALTSAAVTAPPPGATGVAGGLFSVARQTGATFGVAAAGAIIGAQLACASRAHAFMAVAAGAAALAWHLVSPRSVPPVRVGSARRFPKL